MTLPEFKQNPNKVQYNPPLTPQQPKDNYPAPAPDINQQVNAMPNADKLTPTEHWLYGKLPGFSQSTIGQALAKFGDSWAGKALSYLDVGAEGIERTAGLVVQLANLKPGEQINLRDAWYAGSLTGDMINLPQLVYGPEQQVQDPQNPGKTKLGKPVIGIRLPTDLPGPSGLADARNKIAQYVSQGMSEHDALIKVKNDFYNSEGALALRSQLYDTYWHVLADPLNYIMPALKPVERIQALRYIAETQKVAYTAEELRGLAKASQTAEDAAKFTKLAEQVDAGTVKTVNRLDKAIITLTGGDIFNPSKASQAIAKVPILNAFQLTPKAKAMELLDVMNNNLGSLASKMLNDPNFEENFTKLITRSASSATTDFGHALLTLEGRTVHSYLKGSEALVQKLFDDYSTEGMSLQRQLLSTLSESLGMTKEQVLKAADQPEALLKLVGASTLGQAVQDGTITSETLGTMGKVLKDMPYDAETFFVHAMSRVEEQAARQAVVQFGIKADSLPMRWSQAMKSAETLAFMRINPAFMIRNVVNNEVTMIARGVFGLWSPELADQFIKEVGWTPSRLRETYSAAEGALKGGAAVIAKASESQGLPEKVAQFFKGIKLGKADIAALSQKAEQAASEVATIQGYRQFIHEMWKPSKLENLVDSQTMQEINRIAPGFADTFDNLVRSSGASDKKLLESLGTNLNLSTNAVLDNASRVVGEDLTKTFGTEILSAIHDGLPQAMKEGKVEQFVFGLRNKIDAHIESEFQKSVTDLVENISAQVQAGGPQVFYDKIAEAQDLFWGGHAEHAIKTPEMWKAFETAKTEKDWAKASSIAARNIADDEKFFGRLFKRVDGYLQGLEDGVKQLQAKGEKIAFPSEVRKTFGELQQNWKDFFSFRNGEYERIRQLPRDERGAAYTALRAELDRRYTEAAIKENEMQRTVDDAVANLITDPSQRRMFMTWRDAVAEQTKTRKDAVTELWRNIAQAPVEERSALLNQFFLDQKSRYEQLRQTERAGLAAMQGNPQAAQLFTKQPTGSIYDLAHQYGIASATEGGARNDRRLLNTINKYGETKYKSLAEVPMDAAQKALEARAAEKGIRPIQQPFVQDYKSVVPDLMPQNLGVDMTAYGRQYKALDAVVESAKEQAAKTPALLKDLPPNLQEKVMAAINQLRDENTGARLAATKYGEFRRDAALLNYTRRTNFDSALSVGMPFAFWTTNSIMKWAIESIDRPAMFTTYLRIKKFLETAGAPQQGFPSRFKDQIRVHLPFAPDWMGDQFIDPLRLTLPFDAFAQPYEQWQQSQTTLQGRAERYLQDQLNNGQITQAQFNNGMAHQGADWQNAVSQVQTNDENLKFDAFDFASLMSTPHAPIVWAYNIARGHPEDIGPFTPMTATVKNIATMLGVKDWNNSSYNIEARVRKQLGLSAFDKWDAYRTDRELSNLAADAIRGKNDFSLPDIQRAMDLSARLASGQMTVEQAQQDPSWKVYEEAVYRSNQEKAGGPSGTLLGVLAIPVHSYPQGEEEQRALQAEFSQAYQTEHKANDAMQKWLDRNPSKTEEDFARQFPLIEKQGNALKDFFDKHPEYETRLGLFDKPADRMKKFLVDQTWAQWNSLPTLTKKELADQLGTDFQNNFLAKGQHNYEAIAPEQMQVWLKLMGGDPPGTMTADQKILTDMFSGQLQLTNPEAAWRTQVFYDIRDTHFKDYYKLQTEYYALPAAKRSQYLSRNPELQQYRDWRRDFMTKNPDLVQYLTDDQKAIAKAQSQRRNPEVAVPTANEIQSSLSPSARYLVQQAQQTGDVPYELDRQTQLLADRYGLTQEEVKRILGLP